MQWCFNTPKAGPLSCVTSPIQKEKIKIVILSILNVLDSISNLFLISIWINCEERLPNTRWNMARWWIAVNNLKQVSLENDTCWSSYFCVQLNETQWKSGNQIFSRQIEVLFNKNNIPPTMREIDQINWWGRENILATRIVCLKTTQNISKIAELYQHKKKN